jgi:putative ABC transport system substrate-binding protein
MLGFNALRKPCGRGPVRRREFITLLGGGAAIWPFAARAQSRTVPRIGGLHLGNADAESFERDLREGLRELGYREEQNILFEFRSAHGKLNLLPELAADLVRLKVDVIVAALTPAIKAAKEATNQIPIVMAAAGDPVGTEFVASLARPGGNITGLSVMATEMAGKSVELFRDMLPSTRRLGVLGNPLDPFTKLFLRQIETDGQRRHRHCTSIDGPWIRRAR